MDTSEESKEYLNEEVNFEEDSNTYTITIHIGTINGLKPVYPVSDIQLSVTLGEEILFQSEKVPMSELIPIEHDIIQSIDIEDLEMVNKFITTPLVFSLLAKVPPKKGASKTKHRSSRSSQGSKTSKKSKKSKKSKDSEKKEKEVPQPSGPQVAGSVTVDMSAIFLENRSMMESLILKAPAGQPLDDRAKSASNLPMVQVDIFLDKPIPRGNMFYYTLETIYNLPKVMTKGMNYQMVIGIPIGLQYKLVPFDIFTYCVGPREKYRFKQYYGSTESSNYIIKDDFDDVMSILCVEFSDFIPDVPRLEYNQIKGEFASDEDIESFKTKIKRYHYIGVELYMTNPDVTGPIGSKSKEEINKTSTDASKKSSKKGSKQGSKKTSKKGSKRAVLIYVPDDKKDEEYLHLMAFIDICRLLYPGEQKLRVASELRTFNLEEFQSNCGISDSYFRPKPAPATQPAEDKEKLDNNKSTKDTSPKESRMSKSSKASKKSGKGKKAQGDLKAKLPKAPIPPPASEPVYDEQGQPTFIIMEFEFRNPITPKHEIEDLHSELEELIQKLPNQPPEIPRDFKSKYLAQDIFLNSIKGLFQNLKQNYLEYQKNDGGKENLLSFIEYLTRSDQYQVYMNTLTQSASNYCDLNKKYDPEWSVDEYHAFIGQAYVDLVELLNTTINHIGLAGAAHPQEVKEESDSEGLLFYAKEAAEINAFGLAQHYYLQRIKDDDTNSAYWLDYAIFKLQIGENDAAVECAIEALKNEPNNADCLIFFALLMAREGKYSEAETCVLNVTLCNPKWLEGWMALYCVYLRSKNREGIELCLEMAAKYAKADNIQNRFDDLIWCGAKLPNTYTFRSVKYFINLRLLDEAELILADELLKKNTDVIEYLLAVLSLMKGNVEHAYDHIEESFRMGGCAYWKNLLRGHIFMAMDELDCALVEYEKIVKSTEDIAYDGSIHLVYIRAGLCYSALGMHQLARKILLKASEKKGTPYTWLATGVLYYHQHDYMSAEECLMASNTLDNILPETWAYLTLVNIKLGRLNEATSCYHQAIDHRLQNEDLMKTVDYELAQWEENFFDSKSSTQSMPDEEQSQE
ncbi:LOW QUALITY PROTEIN: uncharacterized protein [Atheta coriaria]|uniref:LOW QUALITY PROTEIN: uncharacterized protein n=1 Tax=Dalotia coriaria TaxID=877792 RepID=UPI0031F388A0